MPFYVILCIDQLGTFNSISHCSYLTVNVDIDLSLSLNLFPTAATWLSMYTLICLLVLSLYLLYFLSRHRCTEFWTQNDSIYKWALPSAFLNDCPHSWRILLGLIRTYSAYTIHRYCTVYTVQYYQKVVKKVDQTDVK